MKKNVTRLLILFIGFVIWMGLSRITKAQDKTLLYQIEGKGIKNSWIYGTVHLLPQSSFVLGENVKTAFGKADQIVLELDMDNPMLQMEMFQNITMRSGNSLDKLLSKDDFERLDQTLQRAMGVGAANFNTWKPMMLASVLMPIILNQPLASYEATFVQMATESGKEVIGLETVKEQLDIFDKIPYESQAKQLSEMIQDTEKQLAEFEKLIKIYHSGDKEAMFTYMQAEMDDPLELKYLITDRNQLWIERINQIAKEKSSFFGVGSAHLGGELGVISLLKKAGYKVTPVM